MHIKNIIFDFGGVLMDWNPRYYYKDYFQDEKKMEYFLKHIAKDEWNAEQDRGRSLREGTEILVAQHPDWETEIRAYYDKWTTMLKGEIASNVAVLRELANTKYELFGLTNWSAETFPYALDNYDFFALFEGKIVVSGTEKLIKPDPAIWQLLLDRYQIRAEESIFIDDNPQNIATAQALGFHCVHITENTNLKEALSALSVQFTD